LDITVTGVKDFDLASTNSPSMGCGKSVDSETELRKLIAKQRQQIADLTRANAAIQKSVEDLRSLLPSDSLRGQVLQLETKLAQLSEKALLRHASTLSRDEDLPSTPGEPLRQPLHDKGVWEDPQIKEMLERRRKLLVRRPGNEGFPHS